MYRLFTLSLAAMAIFNLSAGEKPLKAFAKEIQDSKYVEERFLLFSTLQMAAAIGASNQSPLDHQSYKGLKKALKAHALQGSSLESIVKAVYPIALSNDLTGSLLVLDNDSALFSTQDISEITENGDTLSISALPFTPGELTKNTPAIVNVKNKTKDIKLFWMARVGQANPPSLIAAISSSKKGEVITYTILLKDGSAWKATVETGRYRFNSHVVLLNEGLREWVLGDKVMVIFRQGSEKPLLYNVTRNMVLIEGVSKK